MDNEKINGVPEEETEVPAAEAEENAAEASEEAAENTEVISETEDAQAAEEEAEADKTEEISEEENETEETVEEKTEEALQENTETEETEESENEVPAEDADDEDLCASCGENEKQEDSEYCAECEAVMLSRKIPFLGWLSGLAVIVFSVFALVLAVLVSAPVLQIARGDIHAANNCWYTAYNEYQGVSSIVEEVNSIIGTTSPFVQTGSALNVKIVRTVAECYSPLEAITVAESLLGEDAFDKFSTLKKYEKIREDYVAAYEAVMEPIEAMVSGTADKETTYAAFESVLGTEGINDVYINYFLYNASAYYKDSEAVQLKYLDAVEASASADGGDYAWLYYQDYADTLYNNGDTEKAMKYLDALTNSDKTKFGAYELKLRIAIADGDMDEANRILAEFKTNNEGYDTAYVLEATLLRCQGEYEKAELLLEEALEQYDSVPELHRQLALIYLLDGDYDNAFEEAFQADSNAYYLYAYMGDSSGYTPQLNNTLYLCTYLCREKGTASTDNAIYIEDILDSFAEEDLSEQVLAVVRGEKTVEQVLSEGVCDLA